MNNPTIKWTVIGVPKPKGRPRFFRRGEHVGSYTPQQTRSFEANVLTQSVGFKPAQPLEQALALTLRFYIPPTKTMMKKKSLKELIEGEVLPVVVKPDLDNLVKSVVDALNGVFWLDDKQIYELTATKLYSFNPRVDISLTKKEGQPN